MTSSAFNIEKFGGDNGDQLEFWRVKCEENELLFELGELGE